MKKHTRNPASGRIRQERKDSKMVNLKEEYKELQKLTGKAGRARTLGGAEKALGVTSLDQLRGIARKKGR